jgi:hypothetical protein
MVGREKRDSQLLMSSRRPDVGPLRLNSSVIPLLLLSAVLAGNPASPSAATAEGMAAYHRGDFATAMAILKPIVYDVSPDRRPPFGDPWATAYVAQMFRRGEGVATDWPLSCALFNSVWAYTRGLGPEGYGTIPFVDEGIREVCLPEFQPEVNALRMACYLDGVTHREFVLDGDSWLVADRRGFHIDLGGGEYRDVPMSMWCHDVVVSLTQADVSVQSKWSAARMHFLELFKWANGIDETSGSIVRQLHWIVYGVRGAHIAPVTDQTMLTMIGGPYPTLEMPPGIRQAAVLRLNDAGQVEWAVAGPFPKRGIIAEFPREENATSAGAVGVPSRFDELAGDFAVRFDHKGCHYEYLDMFKGTYSASGVGPLPFALSEEQRSKLFKAIVAARIFSLPPVVDASGGEASSNYELEVRNAGQRRRVSWNIESADRSLTELVRTVLNMVNPSPGDGCVSGPPKVR